MKRLLITAVLLCLCNIVAAQRIVRDDYRGIELEFSVGDVAAKDVVVDGRKFTTLAIDGYMPSAEVGAPCLPTFSALIEVPLCNGFDVMVHAEGFDTIEVGTVLPAQPSRSKSDREHHSLVIDERLYATDAYYGGAAAIVEPAGVARDRNLARLQFSPVSYNPVKGQMVVCRKATVTVTYSGADREGTLAMFERYHSPAFASGAMTLNSLYPKDVRNAAPLRYLIVAHSSFRGQMDAFVQWKRRKGFLTDIVYTDDAGVGTTSTAIAAYVKSQYTNATSANPAPTYLLIVGDHEQIPAFAAQVTSPSSDHITDLYYVSWTSGDVLPDCYCGRFSAQSVSQLTPQIEKTLMYEQYTFADPSFLDRAVMVAGIDNGSSGDYGYTHADPAMDYAITNYINGANGYNQVKYFKNNTSIVPTGSNVTVSSNATSNAATVRSYYNQGAGWINYSAHGSATGWYSPSFTTSHASSMTNTQKFGIMIGNCCLTNKFETTTCLGEAVLRKDNYCGAVGYIGGSNSTYWNEDFYWAVGLRSGIGPSMSMAYNGSNLGVYDRVLHTHGEAQTAWVETQGELMMMGNMAVQSSTSSYKNYYWEIYHLMGDPSLMPYMTQAPVMTVSVSSVVMVGTTSLSVVAAPYAYVALTDTATHSLKASGFANASGQVTLTLPGNLPVGGYELVASAQQYQTAFRNITVVPSSGPYPVVTSITAGAAMNAGNNVPLTVKIANIGSSIARNVSVAITSDNSAVSITGGSIALSSIAAGDTVTVTTPRAVVGISVVDQSTVTFTANTSYTGSGTPTTANIPFTLNAPVVEMAVASGARNLLPGSDLVLSVTVANSGHSPMSSSHLDVTTGSTQLTATVAPAGNFTLAAGASVTRQITLHASSSVADGTNIPVYLQLTGSYLKRDTLSVYVGESYIETFEGGSYAVQGWSQGTYPWEFTSSEHHEGNYSARSNSSLSHNQTSEMSITLNVATADSVSFWYKVSSEANYDKFHFYIDNAEKLVNSGVVGWTRAAYPIAAGSHTLKFSYSKDGSVNSNEDCAWIDNVTLPRPVPSYAVNVSATHGTPTGSGVYYQGETATVGVYPNAGYAFVRWNDGNTINPRQVVVSSPLQLTATLSQGGVTTVHDTVVVTQHDTTTITNTDTVMLTDTVVVTETLLQTDTVTVMDTLLQVDTVLVVEQIPVHDTTVIYDTTVVYSTEYVHDTTIVYSDTVVVEVAVHDTTYIIHTVVVSDTVSTIVYDTIVETNYVYVYDTVISVVMDTIVNTLYDTIVNTMYDTITEVVEHYVYDTVVYVDTLWLHDTVYIHDTVYVDVNGVDDVQAMNVRLFQRDGKIVVEGAEGYSVSVFDIIGRKIESFDEAIQSPVMIEVPASGVYLVRIGQASAKRVVVIK